MAKKYIGRYDTFEELVAGSSLQRMKKKIEAAMGKDFKEYETAWIEEYSSIGRRCASYYFSIKDKQWHAVKWPVMDYRSWSIASQPLKAIMQWIIKITGHKKEQEDRFNRMFP